MNSSNYVPRGNRLDFVAFPYASLATDEDLHAAAIVTVTSSCSTARKVAMYRPSSPIIAVNSVKSSIGKLQIARGMSPLLCKSGASMKKEIKNGIKAALQKGLLETIDTIVIIAGRPLHTAGITNMLRVYTIEPKKKI